MRKHIITILLILLLLLTACGTQDTPAMVAATTLPVYEFTTRLCEGTDITVTRLVTENVSCLHDYALNVRQVRAAEAAEIIVINGAGLEAFMEDLLTGKTCIDASRDIALRECEEAHDHEHDHEHEGHSHEEDSHIWLSPANAIMMARNICQGLSEAYPESADVISSNLETLISDLEALEAYGETQLTALSCRNIVTFHDGFGYFADAYGLTILEAVEEESGSEASASDLKHLITLVSSEKLPAIFTETNGSVSAASVISRETGAKVFTLSMAMSGESYFDAMYHNIDTIKEALG